VVFVLLFPISAALCSILIFPIPLETSAQEHSLQAGLVEALICLNILAFGSLLSLCSTLCHFLSDAGHYALKICGCSGTCFFPSKIIIFYFGR
jgi:hypothetical protein